jgi:hypothetical protein
MRAPWQPELVFWKAQKNTSPRAGVFHGAADESALRSCDQ